MSSTPRVISSPREWKGQMCLWCNCSEASRDLSGARSPGRSVTAVPHSAAGGNPTVAQSSKCHLLNWPNRRFWTEIHVCLGTEGWHLGFPCFPFRHAYPQTHSRSSPSGQVGWQRLSSSRGCSRGGPPDRVWFCLNGGCYLLDTLNGQVLKKTRPFILGILPVC